MTLRSPAAVDGRDPRPYFVGMVARIRKLATKPAPGKPARKSSSQTRLDALDQMQAGLRARGVDLARWAQDVPAARRETALHRQAEIRNAILETSERCAALPDHEERTADAFLGYDERGGFADGPQGGRRAAPDQLPAVARTSRASTEEP